MSTNNPLETLGGLTDLGKEILEKRKSRQAGDSLGVEGGINPGVVSASEEEDNIKNQEKIEDEGLDEETKEDLINKLDDKLSQFRLQRNDLMKRKEGFEAGVKKLANFQNIFETVITPVYKGDISRLINQVNFAHSAINEKNLENFNSSLIQIELEIQRLLKELKETPEEKILDDFGVKIGEIIEVSHAGIWIKARVKSVNLRANGILIEFGDLSNLQERTIIDKKSIRNIGKKTSGEKKTPEEERREILERIRAGREKYREMEERYNKAKGAVSEDTLQRLAEILERAKKKLENLELILKK